MANEYRVGWDDEKDIPIVIKEENTQLKKRIGPPCPMTYQMNH